MNQHSPDERPAIRRLDGPAWLGAALALNNDNAVETSSLESAGLGELVGQAFHAAMVLDAGSLQAFLIAFDQDAAYDNANFRWFKDRYATFVYVDRIVTSAAARGLGHGRRLYGNLFERARRANHDRIVCEVNRVPPNPGSDAFHRALGFREVGEATLQNGKVVRYLEALPAAGASP